MTDDKLTDEEKAWVGPVMFFNEVTVDDMDLNDPDDIMATCKLCVDADDIRAKAIAVIKLYAGERCSTYAEDCASCKAWKAFDEFDAVLPKWKGTK